MTDVLAARERCILFGIRSMGADETPYLVGFGGQRAEKKCVCADVAWIALIEEQM